MDICRSIISLVLVLAITLSAEAGVGAQDKSSALKLRTVVIDPGHGGKDPGCVSKDRRTYEKNLTLSIAKLFGQKIKDAYPDVKVYYTRTTDKYLTLNERSDIANRNGADLFVSIHINANDKISPNGFSGHIFGRASGKDADLFSLNMDVCRRENSVILLEEDYSTKYQGFDPNDPESFIFFNLLQSAYYEQSLQFAAEFDKAMCGGPIRTSRGVSQDPFYVLWKTTMPSVLVELGFISNAADLKVLTSASGREQIATRLFNAFSEFKRKYDGSLDYNVSREKAEAPSCDARDGVSFTGVHQGSQAGVPSGDGRTGTRTGVPSGEVRYGVQVLVSGKKLGSSDKAFKGYEASAYPSGNIYKYVIGECGSLSEARNFHARVKGRFPDSFVVKVMDGVVSRP